MSNYGTDLFWDMISTDEGAARHRALVVHASQATTPWQQFLAAAATQDEFEARLALVQPDIEARIASITGQADSLGEYPAVRTEVLASLQSAWSDADSLNRSEIARRHEAALRIEADEHTVQLPSQFVHIMGSKAGEDEAYEIAHVASPTFSKTIARTGSQPEALAHARQFAQQSHFPIYYNGRYVEGHLAPKAHDYFDRALNRWVHVPTPKQAYIDPDDKRRYNRYPVGDAQVASGGSVLSPTPGPSAAGGQTTQTSTGPDGFPMDMAMGEDRSAAAYAYQTTPGPWTVTPGTEWREDTTPNAATGQITPTKHGSRHQAGQGTEPSMAMPGTTSPQQMYEGGYRHGQAGLPHNPFNFKLPDDQMFHYTNGWNAGMDAAQHTSAKHGSRRTADKHPTHLADGESTMYNNHAITYSSEQAMGDDGKPAPGYTVGDFMVAHPVPHSQTGSQFEFFRHTPNGPGLSLAKDYAARQAVNAAGRCTRCDKATKTASEGIAGGPTGVPQGYNPNYFSQGVTGLQGGPQFPPNPADGIEPKTNDHLNDGTWDAPPTVSSGSQMGTVDGEGYGRTTARRCMAARCSEGAIVAVPHQALGSWDLCSDHLRHALSLNPKTAAFALDDPRPLQWRKTAALQRAGGQSPNFTLGAEERTGHFAHTSHTSLLGQVTSMQPGQHLQMGGSDISYHPQHDHELWAVSTRDGDLYGFKHTPGQTDRTSVAQLAMEHAVTRDQASSMTHAAGAEHLKPYQIVGQCDQCHTPVRWHEDGKELRHLHSNDNRCDGSNSHRATSALQPQFFDPHLAVGDTNTPGATVPPGMDAGTGEGMDDDTNVPQQTMHTALVMEAPTAENPTGRGGDEYRARNWDTIIHQRPMQSLEDRNINTPTLPGAPIKTLHTDVPGGGAQMPHGGQGEDDEEDE